MMGLRILRNHCCDSQGSNAGTFVRNDGASHWFNSPLAKLGGCLKLEGINAFVTLPQTTDLNINTNQFSLSAWVRLQNLPSQLPTSYGAILDSTTDCYVLYLDKVNNELRFKVTDVTGNAADLASRQVSCKPTNGCT